MVPPKKRSKETESQSANSEDSQKLPKRFRPLFSIPPATNVDTQLVETFAKMLQSSLFMHHGRLLEIRSVLEEPNVEEERVNSIRRLMDILRRPPAVPSFLSDMLLLFLKPEEALDLNCFEAYRSRMQSLDILARAQLSQRVARYRPLLKGPLRLLHDSPTPDAVDPHAIYESLSSWLGGDPRLCEFILPLFADQPVDASNVSINDFETVRSDFLHEHEADEFEVINWTDAFDHEASSFRQCACSCHQDNPTTSGLPVSHCGSCSVKFFGEHAYIWRGSRLVRAQIEMLDAEEPIADTAEGLPATVSPTKIFSSGGDTIDNDSDWARIFRAIDSMDNGDAAIETSPIRKPLASRSGATTPRKSVAGQDPAQDVLKQAFMETFGRNLWGKGYSPLKRPGLSFGIGGPSEESNSASCVFVRGYDGANTMLATLAVDSSNSGAPPSFSDVSFAPRLPAADAPGCSTVSRMSSIPEEGASSSARPETQVAAEEEAPLDESWTEDDDRFLLDQFKLHGNLYEATTAAMAALRKSRHAVRDRLKLLLDLLKEAM